MNQKRKQERPAAKDPWWREPFLEALRRTGHLVTALALIQRKGAPKVHKQRIYELKACDEIFASEFADAIDESIELLEAEARRRAHEGIEEPIFYKGERVDVKRVYSDVLIMFLLKANRPEKYRDPTPTYAVGGQSSREIGREVVRALNEMDAATVAPRPEIHNGEAA